MKQQLTATALRHSFDRRSIVLGAVQGGVGLLLAARMGYIAVAENERYQMLAESNRVNLTLIPPRRGWILDREGAPLASNRADFRVDIIPERARAASSRSRSPAGLTGTASPPSAFGSPTCPAWCRSAAIRASIRPAPRSAT